MDSFDEEDSDDDSDDDIDEELPYVEGIYFKRAHLGETLGEIRLVGSKYHLRTR